MVQFRRRHDNGRAFPIGNRPDGGLMNELKKQDFNRLKKEVAKGTRDAGNNLAIREDGKIKDGAIPAIKGAPDQEAEAKQIIKNESEMVKEIKKVEYEKHPGNGKSSGLWLTLKI